MRGLLAALSLLLCLLGCTPSVDSEQRRVETRREAVVGPLAATPLDNLTPTVAGSLVSFGGTVAVDGKLIATGAPSFNDGSGRLGSVFLFKYAGDEIRQIEALGRDDRVGASLGNLLAFDSGRLATNESDPSGNTLNVYYEENSGAWYREQRLAPQVPDAHFPRSLALSKDTIVAGAPVYGAEPGIGSAYVFIRGATRWSEQARLFPGSETIQAFGQSVAVEGDVVAVGFPGGDTGPSVWIFERSAGRFTETARLAASDATPRNLFGQVLAISAGHLYVGAPNAQLENLDTGAVYEFTKSEGAWQESGKLAPSQGIHRAEFGSALAADWPWILIGAHRENDTGAAYLFTTETGEWIQALRIEASPPGLREEFAQSVGLFGNLAAIGAPGAMDFGPSSGGVRAYAIGLEPGQSCATSAECAGFCVDGMCCDGLCEGGCETCRAAQGAPKDGVCTALPTGTVAPACFPILCSGLSECPPDCKVAGCQRDYYCDAVSGECRSRGVPGAACSETFQCLSDVCDHGTCCDRACGGCSSCRSVLTAFTEGVCAPVLAGTDPNLVCPPDPGFPENCRADGRCDGGGQCRRFAPPTTACGQTSCTGETIAGKLCNGQGSCGEGSASCAPNQCKDGMCGESCREDGDCADSARCESGACLPKRPNASFCQRDDECASGFCTDGVCCHTRCADQCGYCAGVDTAGTCTAVWGDPRSGRPACRPSATGDPCMTARCDGQRRDQCVDVAVACNQSPVCDGDHQLFGPGDSRVDCSPYRCDSAGVCRRTCSSALECVKGYGCNSKGECVRREHGEDIGCSCQNAGAPSPLGAAAPPLFAAALLLLARRRRVGTPARLSAAR